MDSLKSVCRVCLQRNPETNSFLDEVEYDIYIKLGNVFKKVTGIEVLDTDDDKPCIMCPECTERLLGAHDFICSVEKAELKIENCLKLQASQQLDDEEEQELEEEDVVEIDATDIDIEEIEVLDEEFQTEQEQIESNEDAEIVIVEDEILVRVTSKDNFPEKPSTKNKRAEAPVGSRLSKPFTTRQYQCNSCQRSFAKSETLERHIKTAHTFITPEDLADTSPKLKADTISPKEKSIICPHCPQVFKRRNNFIRHLLTYHSYEVGQLSAEDRELAETKHSYKRSNCPYCGESFTQASLIVHIRRHTGENPYQCDQCDKAFPRRQDLVVHQRQHTGEKPHTCSVCGKSFSRANKLARHMRIHTGERPYKCTECERSFAQSNDLKIHMRRHTGEKPYKCNVCAEAFICGAALKTHRRQKNHHSPEDQHDDPFASWRVCKRKLKTDVVQEDSTIKLEIYEEDTNQFRDLNAEDISNNADHDVGENDVNMEILEIIHEE